MIDSNKLILRQRHIFWSQSIDYQTLSTDGTYISVMEGRHLSSFKDLSKFCNKIPKRVRHIF